MYDRSAAILHQRLAQHADPKSKEWWERYVKESAPFLGVKMATVRSTLHQWHDEHVAAAFDSDQQKELALFLFSGEYTEEKLAGILFLQEILLPAGAVRCEGDIDLLARLFTEGHIYDWNVCDWFCVKVLGSLIASEGEGCAQAIAGWRQAENLWQARASLVAFVPVAAEGAYYPLIADSCCMVIKRPERFAKTAVGWILREISRHDRDFVERVVAENLPDFSRESLNNALKYFTREERQAYL